MPGTDQRCPNPGPLTLPAVVIEPTLQLLGGGLGKDPAAGHEIEWDRMFDSEGPKDLLVALRFTADVAKGLDRFPPSLSCPEVSLT